MLSLPIGYALLLPFLSSDGQGGILGEFQHFGPVVGAIAVVAFLLLVACYARDLQRSLERVSPGARRAAPASVWLMFLLPYNFIEDFFIVANVARSLKDEAKSNPALAGFKSFGLVSGLGWCAAQIVSLLPNLIGSTAGMIAVVLWGWHWAFVRRALGALGAPGARHRGSRQ